MGLQLVDDPTMGIESFVIARGGHALGLRLLAHSMSTQICLSQVETPLELLMEFNDSLVISLVERYLGGTGTGITNGLVDSQLALSHLVSLPIKLAFKLYKSCLPTAISTRDFPRVVSLATIGKVSGTPKISFGMDINNAWSRQSKFVDQCETLATNAHWWCVLEEHHINFDPRLFEEDYRRRQIDHVITEKRFDSSYASTLIPDLIIATSQSAHSIYDSLGLIDRYASDFSIPSVVPISSYVQFLLGPVDGGGSKDDARCRVSDLEGTVRKLLHRVDETKQRLEILRSCLIHFEKDDDCTDYERLSVILSLYQAEMAMFIARDIGNDSVLADSYFMEMEIIDRRRDALAILSSYYEGEKKHQRPSFSDFFVPLSKKVGGSGNTEKPICCNVLGWESSTKLSEGFDPLRPLETTLRMSCSSSVASALSPLCLPLGVPKGYIRTRSLIAKFQKSKEEGAALPPYEEVDSVLKHLRSKSDIAELAEWCSKQYELENPFKLMCLNDALEAAIKASNEAERNSKKEPRSSMESEESLALARVKRISVAKDLLADRMSITTILQKAWDDSDKRSSFARTIQKLLSRLEEEVWKKIDVFVPEHFIDILFIEASGLACDATLCMRDSLSIGQLRKLSQLTHQICSCIAERYSHVQIGHLARRLTTRWLLYGDEHNAEATKEEKDVPIRIPSHAASDVDEEDTVDFQMDLSKLQDGSVWSSYTTGGTAKNLNGKTVVALEEEVSSLKPSSLRETSELSSSRCALRIAFVMAFADGYYSDSWSDGSRAIGGNEENSINSTLRSASKSKRRGLLSKVKASKSTEYNNQHEVVLAHCRELLRLVFAKSTFAGHLMKGLDLSIAAESVSDKKSEVSYTLTFAMRHRCLRVASILVPQDALEQVLKQDNYQTPANQISLKKCAFGAFCAKELEEMQLPIPHSDLGQLSHMHFPSYARALWRHHRDVKRAKGRLLLLIVELYLKEKISDYVFFSNVMKEIGGLRLPRTLLLAFESISRYMNEIGVDCVTSFLESASPFLIPLLSSLSTRISSELKNSTVCQSDGQEEKVCDVYRTSATSTSIRLSQVLIKFSTHASSQELLISHCTCMLDLLHGESKLILEKDLLDMFYQLVLRVESINSRKKLMNRLEDIGVR